MSIVRRALVHLLRPVVEEIIGKDEVDGATKKNPSPHAQTSAADFASIERAKIRMEIVKFVFSNYKVDQKDGTFWSFLARVEQWMIGGTTILPTSETHHLEQDGHL